MSDDTGDIDLILDTSAVSAYIKGSMNVGETLAEVADNEAHFAVPALCLIEAVRLGGPDAAAGAELLAGHTCCEVLPVPADWLTLALASHFFGRTDIAWVFLAAGVRDAAILTAEPASYRAYGDDDGLTIIEI